eukprot:8310587-Pyramimonas_sp.AAC.1
MERVKGVSSERLHALTNAASYYDPPLQHLITARAGQYLGLDGVDEPVEVCAELARCREAHVARHPHAVAQVRYRRHRRSRRKAARPRI